MTDKERKTASMQHEKSSAAPAEAEAKRQESQDPAAEATPAPDQLRPQDVSPAASDDAGAAEEPPAEEGELDPMTVLCAEIETLQSEVKTLRDQALRAMAEAENTRRRAEREKSDAVKFAAIPLLRDLVKVADNMARALAAAGEETPEESANAKALREGVALTEKELLAAFSRHGVARIDPMGEALNPEHHEAMFEMPDENAEPGTIVQVLEPGWLLNGRLIRPARVGVARKP